ncbi:MAG: 23S rRNA (adenine(2503)-C(2))-methyltransferase RlmN [Planctomycetales bacterium]|nr:23S rRNA (adenine(2503)-C(2))-methyltransferase RlmN [Planctomycetales bacterium]
MECVAPAISLLDRSAVDALRRRLRVDPIVMRRMRNAYLKHFTDVDGALKHLPEAHRSEVRDGVTWQALDLHKRCDSQQDGATKLLFKTQRQRLIEAVVLRIATGRTTLCVSSQAGCAAGCQFCATSRMGLLQNLTAREIVDQILQAGRLLANEGRRVRNLVFMGMGEPFHNEDALYEALAAITGPDALHHPPSRVLISSVGIVPAMIRCARRFPEIKLALSLHSVCQATREELIPLARKYPLAEIRDALVAINRIQPPRTAIMIEYLMLQDVNDSLEAASELASFLQGLRVHVNLIPYNPIEDAPQLESSSRERREEFGQSLRKAGLETTIRYSLGGDIDAACGQLVRKQARAGAEATKETANVLARTASAPFTNSPVGQHQTRRPSVRRSSAFRDADGRRRHDYPSAGVLALRVKARVLLQSQKNLASNRACFYRDIALHPVREH